MGLNLVYLFFITIFPIIGGIFDVSVSDAWHHEPVLPFIEGMAIFLLFGIIISIFVRFFFGTQGYLKTKIVVIIFLGLSVGGIITAQQEREYNSYRAKAKRAEIAREEKRAEALIFDMPIHNASPDQVHQALKKVGAEKIKGFGWPIFKDVMLFDHKNEYEVYKIPRNEFGAIAILFQYQFNQVYAATYFIQNKENDYKALQKDLCLKYKGFLPSRTSDSKIIDLTDKQFEWQAKNNIFIRLIGYKNQVNFGPSLKANGFLTYGKDRAGNYSFQLSSKYKWATNQW